MNWLVRRDILNVARGGVLMGIVQAGCGGGLRGGRTGPGASVVRELRPCTDAVISVDTRHAAVAAAVLEAGADVINDISGLQEEGMAELCAEARCGVVAMHMQGRPETMQNAPFYEDVVREVRGYFEERYDFLLGRGLVPEQICWDPGIGFGKTLEHNLALLSNMDRLEVAGRPVLLGLSPQAHAGSRSG